MPSAPVPDIAVPIPLSDAVALAQIAESNGNWDRVARLGACMVAAAPDRHQGYHFAGVAAAERNDLPTALEHFQNALRRDIDAAPHLVRISECCRRLGRLDEGLEAGRRAVRLAPGSAEAWFGLAMILLERSDPIEALAAADRGLLVAPDSARLHFLRAESLLTLGRMEEGWREYPWAFQTDQGKKTWQPKDIPRWNGTPFDDGVLVVYADQGLGDTIQFARYVDWAQGLCPNIVAYTYPQAAPIFRQICPTVPLVVDVAKIPAAKAYIQVSLLPSLHGTRLDSIYGTVPYIHATRESAVEWRKRLDAAAPKSFNRIGITWAGNPRHPNDRRRSAALSDLAPLGRLRDVVLVSLQKGPPADQIAGYFGRAPLINLGPDIENLENTMGIMANLDLVVTVDTSVAHLAGAMGLPTWIMIPSPPDWRWLIDRIDSPWYPTARLFRQTVHRQWSDVVDRIATATRERFELAE